MAVLKQIKFGSSATPIAKSVVAINENSRNALSVVATNDQLTDNADPTYTIALAVDGQTITMPSGGLKTALAIKYEAATTGASATPARIVLADQNGASGYNVLSSVNIDDIVGDGMVDSATYDASTGELTITWAGSTAQDPKTTVIDLGALLDIEDIVIKSDSTDFLSFGAVTSGDEDGTAGQAQIGVKLADVNYSAASGNTAANLTVDTTNGKILDASDAIPAIKSYVDAKVADASTDLAISAAGDNYITAAVDANDNKKINVTADVQALTATAGTVGTYGTDGSQTTAPTAGTLSGTANSLGDAADIATKVKTYVDGAIAIEAARSDAKNKADIAALDVTTDTAVAGQYVAAIEQTDGLVAVKTRANVADAVLTGYSKGSSAPASTDVASTDDVKGAIAKLEWQVDAAEAAAAAGATVVAEGTDAGNNLTIDVATDQTDNHKTYTINLTDVASAQGLADEITRAQTAEGAIDTAVGLTKASGSETRSFTPTTNYGGSGESAATSVMDNMRKLDTQLKAVSDAAAAIQYKVNGTTLEFYGMTAHA